jgi:hypothetical protein
MITPTSGRTGEAYENVRGGVSPPVSSARCRARRATGLEREGEREGDPERRHEGVEGGGERRVREREAIEPEVRPGDETAEQTRSTHNCASFLVF